MATHALTAAGLSSVLLLGSIGCSASSDPPASQPASISFPEVGLRLNVPGELADLTYALGKSEEGQPALYFSTKQLVALGGKACAAGAKSAVSPYPLGQVVLSDETPEHVRKEAHDNPEEDLGEFVTKAGEHYLYYVGPPAEPCSDVAAATALQRRLTTGLRTALHTLEPTA
jgi:hypothetical protein